MTQADSVHSTPPLSVNHLTAGLDWLDVRPYASLREIFRAIRRKEAKEEIDRLLQFLDETDRSRRASASGARKEDHCALRNISALGGVPTETSPAISSRGLAPFCGP
jgi:hypothetical protein